MRTVLVARERGERWDTVLAWLETVHARVVQCAPSGLLAAADEAGPDLVVAGADLRVVADDLARPCIFIGTGPSPGIRIDDAVRPPRAEIVWPVSAESFLELTARMMRVAERRGFRALIRVLRPRRQESIMGTSLDFSLTGMALRVAEPLEPSEPLVISMHLPGGRGSLRLLAEVTRTALDPEDGTPYYGARFVALDAAARQTLREFVWGGS